MIDDCLPALDFVGAGIVVSARWWDVHWVRL